MLGSETTILNGHSEPGCEIYNSMDRDKAIGAHAMVRPIVMACDKSYAMQLAIALRSAVEANRTGKPLDVYVLCDDFSTSIRQKVICSLPEGSAAIYWVPVDLSSFEQFSTLPHISKMTFARFMIPRIFGKDVPRVLYLDADILVLHDLNALWDADLKDAIIGAVLDDNLDPQIKARTPNVEKFPRVKDYFNAGVLLIDLDRWRKERISETALEYLARYPNSPLADQDALNVACDGRWMKLDLHWNFYNHLRTAIFDLPIAQRPKIVHFTGQKPWKASTLSVNADLYDVFRRRTLFARGPLDRFADLAIRVGSRLRRQLGRTTLGKALRGCFLKVVTRSKDERLPNRSFS
jgi:lipopolysaccharide biosynthesis glycosyltransferase